MISMKASVETVCTWKCSICVSISGCNCSVQINWKMAARPPRCFRVFSDAFFSIIFQSRRKPDDPVWMERGRRLECREFCHPFLFFVRQRRNNSRRTWGWGGRCHLRVPWFSDKKQSSWIVRTAIVLGRPEHFRRQMALATHPSITQFFRFCKSNRRGCHFMSK